MPDEIVVQVPEAAGDAEARIRSVTRLAALAGCQAAAFPGPSYRPNKSPGRVIPTGNTSGK